MLPAGLVRALTVAVGTPSGVRSVGGGCINRAARFDAKGSPWFVKWNDAGDVAGMFAAEADGLSRLAATDALAVPSPVAWADASEACPGYLVITHFGDAAPAADFEERLGRGLASLHRVTGDRFGLDRDNFIGSLPQPNDPGTSWVEFFGEVRLGSQQSLAARTGALPTTVLRTLDAVRRRLPELVPDAPPASLLHGDLWSGNYAVGRGGAPVVFDPAVYHGHREIELAFTELFGGFGRRFYQAYESAWPLDPGYAERRDLYNLYPLLVHTNLFGGGYGSQVASIAARYA